MLQLSKIRSDSKRIFGNSDRKVLSFHLFIFSACIAAHAGRKPLFSPFFTDRTLDQAAA